LKILTWNLEVDSRPPAQSVAFLVEHPADIVALQEIGPEEIWTVSESDRFAPSLP
jgi:exonuclease III